MYDDWNTDHRRLLKDVSSLEGDTFSRQKKSFNFFLSLTVYTRVQVNSSTSRIEILKSLFGPKFETLVKVDVEKLGQKIFKI